MIEPARIALLRNAIADESKPWRAERNQLIRVHWQNAPVYTAELCLRRPIVQKVSCHPVIAARAGEIFDRLSPIAAQQRRSSFARGADQSHGEARLKRKRHQRRFAETGYTFYAHMLRVYCRVGLKRIQASH